MKISGVTFVKNAIVYDYPIVEAIKSILPICDEVIVVVGLSTDETLSLIQNINNPKIKIINSVWDESLREGGRILAVETNKALDAVAKDSDWCFYIQGDEVLHEKDLSVVKQAMQKYLDDKQVEGLLFDYLHFWGTYDYVGDSRRWYRKEIRVVRNDPKIRSYKDAQGFRKNNNKLQVKKIAATIHHYGWVKPPQKQQAKQQTFHKLWHNDDWVSKHVADAESYDYSEVGKLRKFEGSHPKVMQGRIDQLNWLFTPNPPKQSIKEVFLGAIEQLTGYRIGEYQNYKILK
ncbi:MAG: glycosyltransferase family 2 protein [Aureispira sp.]|nr:glycosyltransferase family 2 protein [Aureispira sp.]